MKTLESSFLQQVYSDLKIAGKKIIPWNKEEQEAIYTSAYSLYGSGDYGKAADLFTQLVLLDPFQEVYWRALAASRQMEAKYEDALRAWCLVALFADSDPLPHFHAAECLLSMGDKEEAKKALAQAENRAEKRIEDKETTKNELRNKIELLKSTL